MNRNELIKNNIYLLPYNLQFFADEVDKTEEPTGKKLKDARSDGQAARSNELVTATGLTSLFLMLQTFSSYYGNQFIKAFRLFFGSIHTLAIEEFSIRTAQSIMYEAFRLILLTCLPAFIIGVIVAFIITLYQVKWTISTKLIKPKLSRINPVSGMKRLLNKSKIVELLVDVVKIIVICFIAYSTLKNEWQTLFSLPDMKLEQAILLIGKLIIALGLKISIIFLIIGVADYIYQKFKFKKDLKMSKQEVKDEYKNSEGDPAVKGKIKAKMREASMRRMMQALPQADVVITNPTHLAAAIQYDKSASAAPVLIAKGADYLAQKIKEVAKEHNIEIVENKPLARMLYYNVEIGSEIPPELYQMTAEVLAYVYGLKNKVS
jgi:flagellar biosynthetic protein FlhB